ncbi:MAG: BBE domain-containing protein [Chloracidobacterium sp.]|nr:BBE domain-containing protein [Chloracidobacterium sp.]
MREQKRKSENSVGFFPSARKTKCESRVDAHSGLGAIHASRASCSAVAISSTVVGRTDSFLRYFFRYKIDVPEINCLCANLPCSDSDDEGPERSRASYGVNYGRLVVLKRRYAGDPANLFQLNQNILPATG